MANNSLIIKKVLNEIFYRGGLFAKSYYQLEPQSNAATINKRCNSLCRYLAHAKPTSSVLSSIDFDIEYLAKAVVVTAEDNSKHKVSKKTLSAEIAKFMFHIEHWWNDRNLSTYEKDHITTYLFGKALYDYNCFVSQEATPVGSTSDNTVANNKTSAQGPAKNDYKSRGPLSGQAYDLKGQPGQKIYLTEVYTIVGTDAQGGHLAHTTYAKPLETSGRAGSTNKVFMGTPKAYGYCQLYFDSQQSLYDFEEKLADAEERGDTKLPKDVAGLDQKQCKPLTGGYFKIGTEFGDAYISAFKLNEAIQESNDATKTYTLNEEEAEQYLEDFYYKN